MDAALRTPCGVREDIKRDRDNICKGIRIRDVVVIRLIQDSEQRASHATGSVCPNGISGNPFQPLG